MGFAASAKLSVDPGRAGCLGFRVPQPLTAACDRLLFLRLAAKYSRANTNIRQGHVHASVTSPKMRGSAFVRTSTLIQTAAGLLLQFA